MRLRHIWSLLGISLPGALASTETTILSVTSTTTVRATSTDYTGACDDFTGACVVYGTSADAPYTTTVYVHQPTASSTSFVTSTTTVLATTTASDSTACNDFSGACVVHGVPGRLGSTVYYASTTPGNGQGYLGPKHSEGAGSGLIGGATSPTTHFAMGFGMFAAALLFAIMI